jgi:hypothetical protein
MIECVTYIWLRRLNFLRAFVYFSSVINTFHMASKAGLHTLEIPYVYIANGEPAL